MKTLIMFAVLALHAATSLLAAETPLELSDIHGRKHAPLVLNGKKAAVVIFISRDCPIANAFVPEINRLAAEYDKDFAFWLVQGDPDISAADAKKHAEFFNIKPTILLDPEQRLAKLTNARNTPEAVVLGDKGAILYQGRINDLYASLTKKKKEPTTHDLKDALDALRAGSTLPKGQKAIGCSIPLR
jgi:hypothetical protein